MGQHTHVSKANSMCVYRRHLLAVFQTEQGTIELCDWGHLTVQLDMIGLFGHSIVCRFLKDMQFNDETGNRPLISETNTSKRERY